MNKLIATAAVLALTSTAFATDVESNMVPVKKGAYKETLVNSSVDLTKYNKIMFVDSELEFRDVKKGANYSSTLRSNKTEFWVSEKDRARAATIVTEAFGKEIAKSKHFGVVDAAGPGVLVIKGKLSDIVSHVPPPMVGHGRSYISKIATATIELEARDSVTGELVFTASERSSIEAPGREMIEANSVRVNSELRRWSARAATKMVRGLDSIHS